MSVFRPEADKVQCRRGPCFVDFRPGYLPVTVSTVACRPTEYPKVHWGSLARDISNARKSDETGIPGHWRLLV